MASFKAKLLINEEERTILNVQQSFNQIADITGRPDGKPYGDPLFLSLESTIDDSFFYHHMFDHNQMIHGEIIFYKRDGFSILYKIEFANAYILGLEEFFEADGEVPLHFNLKIGWGIARINGIVHEEDWNIENPFEGGGEVTVIENLEPELLEYYIENLENKRIKEKTIKENQEIYLVIISENTEGEIVDIHLDNKSIDFQYNGEWMENDIIEDIVLNDNYTKVKLKAIKQKEN